MLALSRQMRRENTAMGGDNRNVESIRQRLLLEEAQRGANTADIYNLLQKSMPQKRAQETDPVVSDTGPPEKDPSRQRSWKRQTYNPDAMYYELVGNTLTPLQTQVIGDSFEERN